MATCHQQLPLQDTELKPRWGRSRETPGVRQCDQPSIFGLLVSLAVMHGLICSCLRAGLSSPWIGRLRAGTQRNGNALENDYLGIPSPQLEH